MGKNKITKLQVGCLLGCSRGCSGIIILPCLQGLDKLCRLRVLSIQSNRLTKIEGLEALVNLEELYVSHNGIKKMEGLDTLVKLVTLDVSNNFIKRIENVSHLTLLEEFWVSISEHEVAVKILIVSLELAVQSQPTGALE